MSQLPLLFEDELLVAVDKPAGWIIHPTRGARGAPIVLQSLRDQLGRHVYPVHRLDRQASGVLVMAKSSEAAGLLSEHVREGRWRKRYLGLCRGPVLEALKVDHPVPEEKARRPAVTLVDPLETFCERYTLVSLEPLAGRRHQIRYHLKHASHPLIGDASYGQGAINRFFGATFGLRRLFLHAERLRLPHPVENRELDLRAPLAEELVAVLERLRAYSGPVL